ncbi:siroheme synthase [Ramaria rubella]|nr:siroheme synthase [Ramaria rubella]
MATAVQSGASLLLAWQLKDRNVVIVGGGDVASQRLVAVLSADAKVTLISPRSGLHPRVTNLLASSDRITYHDRLFGGPADLKDADMVLTAIDDVGASREICVMCRSLKIPVNVADVPPSCDFYFGAQVRRGPLQVMVSTNGNGPKLASLIKQRIEEVLPENAGQAIEKVGLLRQKLRRRAPGVGGDLGKRRMKWMTGVCETWSLDELALLDEEAMERLLDDGWEHDLVLRPRKTLPSRPSWLQGLPDGLGSFGLGVLTGLLTAATALAIARRRGVSL